MVGILCVLLWAQDWKFVDVTAESGTLLNGDFPWVCAYAGDFDNDGWPDLLVTRAGGGPNLLYRNKGDGTFEDVAARAGVAMFGRSVISALFFDYDGDGHLDIFAGLLGDQSQALFRNLGDGRFEEVSQDAGITLEPQVFSAAAGDYDRDGDLDLYLAANRLNAPQTGVDHLWRNDGASGFTGVGEPSGILAFKAFDRQFTPNFTDINNDGWPDLLLVADFNTSQVYLNDGTGNFDNITDRNVITDEGGMGSAVGDYDNDGDMDWFVSSIWDPDQNPDKPWGVSTGNRLYRNRGDGTFDDVTDDAGVRIGYWGWGSVFGDLNNDNHLDIFHTNGFVDSNGPFFERDPSRAFISNGDGTFTERSVELGLDDTARGDGVVAFDYDRDGDLDLFVGNAAGGSKLFRNEGGNQGNWTAIGLRSNNLNAFGVGARLYLSTSDGIRRTREIRSGNNYLSQNPIEAHFGMGQSESGDLEIVWPDGTRNKLFGVETGEVLLLPKIPVSYTQTDLGTGEYYAMVRQALDSYQSEGRLDGVLKARLRHSALKAFIQEKYPAKRTGQ